MISDSPLPVFRNPPLQEVALGVQFEHLNGLLAPHLGKLWTRFAKKFPRVEQHAPLTPVIETFLGSESAAERPQFSISEVVPTPRVWLLDDHEAELVQVQQDRFVRNWRAIDGDSDYPRYSKLRGRFVDDYAEFQEFLSSEGLGPLAVNQCEVTYVNHVPLADASSLADLTLLAGQSTYVFTGKAEYAKVVFRFLMCDKEKRNIGRLHISVSPAVRRTDGANILVMNLIARGFPHESSGDAVLGFLDIGHEYVVRAFKATTTQQMHEEWGLVDA